MAILPQNGVVLHPLRRSWAVWTATAGGAGRFRWAPGTIGAAIGLPWAMGIERLPPAWAAAAITASAVVGALVVGAALRQLGLGKDPSCIVLDEIVSMPMTFFLVPMSSISVVVLGFALNRLFDISKPPPLGRLERIGGGWGVMADDWGAGIYSNLVLRVAVWSAPQWFV